MHRQLGKQRKLASVQLGCIFSHKENFISQPLRANVILDGRIVAYWFLKFANSKNEKQSGMNGMEYIM